MRHGFVHGAVVVLALHIGCAGEIDRDYYLKVDRLMSAGAPNEAAEEVREAGKTVYGERNRLLYHMDLGMALHVAGDWAASARQLEAADRLGEDLYTKSLSSEAASLVTSDLTVPYAGEEFERILVNVVNAINHDLLGSPDEALVEVRRVEEKFRYYHEHAEGRYRKSAFAFYLAGMFYENAGMPDDALISYRDALVAYREGAATLGVGAPVALERDVSRLSSMLGADPGVELDYDADSTQGKGEIIALHYLGPGPRKKERIIEFALGQGLVHLYSMDVKSEEQKDVQRAVSVAKGLAASTQVTIAYPVFDQPPLSATQAVLEVDGCGQTYSVLVENVSQVASVNLEDRMGAQWARIVARAVLKFLLAQAAGDVAERLSGNKGVGLLFHAVTQASLSAAESADTRGWRTLPALIHMSRVNCPPGLYNVRIMHVGGRGGGTLSYSNVKVQDGYKTLVVSSSF